MHLLGPASTLARHVVPGVKKSAAETVLLMRCAAGVPLVQRDPSTSGWRRPPALVRWMAVVCRSDWAAALPAHPTGSTRWTGSGYHVVIASTAAELACSAARWRGAGAPVTEKASSEAALWLTALGRGVYWRCRGETSPSWGHCALPRHWLAIFTVWRLGPVAWQLSPTHACQGVGCRY